MFQFIACITRATPYPDVHVDLLSSVSAMSAPKAPQGQFTLLYFASATSYTRKQHDFLPAPLPILELHDKLEKLYPGIVEKVLRSCAVTVNLDYVDLEAEASKGEKGLVIQPGDEVAIIPPVSSG
ncbi:hypothetical protein KC363_g4580 [Hortaea werneckii]|nr:hypothetical protein KC363_g4580 [Hortaea werneckii]